MKRAIPILVLSSALLTGCGSYTDPGYSYTNVSPNETSVRAKIIAGARAGRWDVCDLDENSLRLTKDFKNTKSESLRLILRKIMPTNLS